MFCSFRISVIVKLCSVIVRAGTVRCSLSPVAMMSAIRIYPDLPSSVAASTYVSLKFAVFITMSPWSSVAATFPGFPVVRGISVHQLLLLGGANTCGLLASQLSHL